MLKITKEDKDWIVDSFVWLAKNFPDTFVRTHVALSYSENNFSHWFQKKKHLDLYRQVARHFKIDKLPTQTILKSNIEKASVLNTEIDGKPHLEIILPSPKNFKKEEQWVSKVIIAYAHAVLLTKKVKLDNQENTSFFLFLTLVYFGYGPIILEFENKSKKLFPEFLEIPKDFKVWSILVFYKLKQIEFDNLTPFLSFIKVKKAEKTYTQIATDPQINQLALKKVLETTEKALEAESFYQLGHFEIAISLVQEIIPKAENKNQLKFTLGKYFNRSRKYQLALDTLESISNELSISNEAQNEIAFSYLSLGQKSKAYTILNRLDKTPLTNRNLAIYYSNNKEFKKADEAFKFCTKTSPIPELTYYFWGLSYLEQGDKTKALECFRVSSKFQEVEGIQILAQLQDN